MSGSPQPRTLFGLVAVALLLMVAGCPHNKQGEETADAPQRPLAGVKLRLCVVGDPAIAAACERLEGEWDVQTGSELDLEAMTVEQFDKVESIEADAVICPTALVGPLARRDRIVPLPEKLKESGGEWAGMFELPKVYEAAWAGRVVAVPFGSPVLVCYYRADLFEKLQRKPPATWADYQRLAEQLADRSALGEAAPAAGAPWFGTIEPLGPGWAGLVLLARAAPYAKHRDYYSALFDTETMEPLVAGPAMVRALEELAAAAKLGPPEALDYRLADVRAAFWKGQCGMALCWPTAGDCPDFRGARREGDRPDSRGARRENGTVPLGHASPAASPVAVGFAELPGSKEAYHIGDKAWENRPDAAEGRVPLVGAAGRFGAVLRTSKSPDAALQLLLWLSGKEYGTQVCSVSSDTTLFRRSQLQAPEKWTEPQVSASAARQYAELTAATLQRQQWVAVPSISGRAEYLAALDRAVRAAVRGEKTPAEALAEAADQWRKITEQHGVEAQRAAYRKGLGL